MTCSIGEEAKTKCVMHKMDTKLCIAVSMFKLRFACSDDFFFFLEEITQSCLPNKIWHLANIDKCATYAKEHFPGGILGTWIRHILKLPKIILEMDTALFQTTTGRGT